MSSPLEERVKLAATEGRIKRLHVDQQLIRKRDPNPLTVQTSAGSIKCAEAHIDGPSKLVYGDKPLSCGARVWIETTSTVTLPGLSDLT